MSVVASRPVIERIADAIYQRLRLLTAGYSPMTAVSEVLRPTQRGGFTPKHLQIVITQSDPEEMPELSHAGNPPAQAWRQVFNLRCHVNASEKDPTSVDTILNTMAADVQKVICDSGAQWYSFGGLSVDAQWLSRENIDADGGIDGVNVPLAVTYRVSEGNPYEVRV